MKSVGGAMTALENTARTLPKKRVMILPDRLLWHPLDAFVEKHALRGKVLVEKWEKPRRRRGSDIFWKVSFIIEDGAEIVEVPKDFIKAIAAKAGRLNRNWARRYWSRLALMIEMRPIPRKEAERKLREGVRGA